MAPRKKTQEPETAVNTEKNAEQELSLEESFAQLDGILDALEQDELSLEDSFAMYQRGMQLIKSCGEKIDVVEKKILIMNGDGSLDEF